jgi:hypothetical protein
MTSFVDIMDMHLANAKASRSFFELIAAAAAIVGIVYGLENRN